MTQLKVEVMMKHHNNNLNISPIKCKSLRHGTLYENITLFCCSFQRSSYFVGTRKKCKWSKQDETEQI